MRLILLNGFIVRSNTQLPCGSYPNHRVTGIEQVGNEFRVRGCKYSREGEPEGNHFVIAVIPESSVLYLVNE